MTPVLVLSDAFVANSSEPWRIPRMSELEPIVVEHPGPTDNEHPFQPYTRNCWLARPWALPGTPGLMHRLGGLEKQDVTGEVSYDATNHQHMVELRAAKVAKIADDLPPQEIDGPPNGRLLVLSWGGTYGALVTAVRQCRAQGTSVAHAHLRYLHPLPSNLGELLKRYQRVLVAELNRGQLRSIIRNQYLIDAMGLNKTTGRPFAVAEVIDAIDTAIA
jgi:2-oxoglutarate ferredoxin oxidoreductase subunit alpha